MDMGSFAWGALVGSAGTIVALVKLIQYGKRETERSAAESRALVKIDPITEHLNATNITEQEWVERYRRN